MTAEIARVDMIVLFGARELTLPNSLINQALWKNMELWFSDLSTLSIVWIMNNSEERSNSHLGGVGQARTEALCGGSWAVPEKLGPSVQCIY